MTSVIAENFKKIDRPAAMGLELILVAVVVTFLVYLPGLSGPLFLDDIPQLQGLIDHSADDTQTLIDAHIVSGSGPAGRPVSMSSFVVSAVSHGPDIWWWKYENVLFHLISGLLVFWLSVLLLRAIPQPVYRRPWLIGAAVASVWLLHPLQVSTVLYTVQRMTELSSLFVFAGLICYVKGRQRQIDSRRNGWLLIALGFAVFLPLALLSKESGALFPVFCGLLELLVFQFRGEPSSQRALKVFHGLIVAAYLVVTVYVLANFSDLVLSSYAFRDFTFSERIYTEFRVVALYLSQLLIPAQNKMGFFHDDIVHSTSLISPITTALSAILSITLIASAFYLRKRLPLYAFGILFFFAGHLLESTFIALELMFEHRNYLPSLGIFLAVFAVLHETLKKQNALVWIAVIGLSGLALLTWQRAITWGTANTMYPYMYRVHPESPRLNLIFTESHARMGNYNEARISLAKMKAGMGPGIHKLFLDCLEYGSVSERGIMELLGPSDGLLDGQVAVNVQELSQAAIERRCTVPENAFIALMDHTLTLRSRSGVNEQKVLLSKARFLESRGQD